MGTTEPDVREAKRVARPERSWRYETLSTRVAELRALARWECSHIARPIAPDAEAMYSGIYAHLDSASMALTPRARSGILAGLRPQTRELERAISNLDAAEALLLRIASTSYVRAQLPRVLEEVQRLPLGDPYRLAVERITASRDLVASDREMLAAASRRSSAARLRERLRVRSFRSIVAATATALTAVALGLAITGAIAPDALPLCFPTADELICPSGAQSLDAVAATSDGRPADVAIVEMMGAVGGSLGAALSIRGMRGTSTPISIPIWLALLKIPTGALTALAGILLFRGEFIPGLGGLESTAQILAWAVVFGYAQQLLTSPVDRQARLVLDRARDENDSSSGAPRISSEALQSAVASTLSLSLETPRLVNYQGALSVRLVDDGGVDVHPDADGRYLVSTARRYLVRATVGRDPLSDSRTIPVLIQDGDSSERVAFEIGLAGGPELTVGNEQPLELVGADATETCELPLRLTSESTGSTVWVRLTQHAALVQLVALDLATRPG